MSQPPSDVIDLHERARAVLGSVDLASASYLDIVSMLTTVRYVADLCIKQLDDRGLLHTDEKGLLNIPDVRPVECAVEHALSREETRKEAAFIVLAKMGLMEGD